jgi:hypothetical protein
VPFKLASESGTVQSVTSLAAWQRSVHHMAEKTNGYDPLTGMRATCILVLGAGKVVRIVRGVASRATHLPFLAGLDAPCGWWVGEGPPQYR